MLTFMILAMLAFAFFAFEFPKTTDKIEDVPEKYRPLYAKGDDGKFNLDDEVHRKTDNTGLVSALDKERKRAKELDKQVNGWKGLGIGDSYEDAMAVLREDIDDAEEEDDKAGAAKGRKQMQKIKAEAEAAANAIKNEYEGKLSTTQKQLKKQMIDTEATVAITGLKGVPELLLPHIREKCLLVEEEGVYNVRVVDAEGDPRSDGKGGFMTVKDLVAEMRQDPIYGRAFEADGKTGSGTRPAGGGSRDGNQKLTPMQKISRGLNKLR